MLRRILPAVSLALLFAIACSEGQPSRDALAATEEPRACADDEGEGSPAATEDGAEPTAAQIADALRPEGVLGMSPEAKEWGANEMEAKVELVQVPVNSFGDPAIGKVAEPVVLEALANFASETEYAASPFRLIDQSGDIHQSMRFGWDEAPIKKALLKIVAEGHRGAVRKLVEDPDLSAYYFWFQIYDIGSEFVGHDIILIVPMKWDDNPVEAIVVHTTYAHA